MTGAVLVLGATGNTGSAVVEALRGFPELSVLTATRAPAPPTDLEHRRFDWLEPATWDGALDGVDRVYLVAPAGHPDPLAVVEPFIEHAIAEGVRRAVLLSSSAVAFGDQGLGEVAAAVRDAFSEWEILRPSWFMQNFVGDHPLADGIRTGGEFVTASGTGRLPFIDARDIGRSAAALLAAPHSAKTEHLLTGPEALSYDEAAAILSTVTGRRARHRAVDPSSYVEFLVAAGYEPAFAGALAALDAQIRSGAQAAVTDAVERLTGTPPRTFAAYLRAHPSRRT